MDHLSRVLAGPAVAAALAVVPIVELPAVAVAAPPSVAVVGAVRADTGTGGSGDTGGMDGTDMPGHDMPGHDMPGHDVPGHDVPGMDPTGADATWTPARVGVLGTFAGVNAAILLAAAWLRSAVPGSRSVR